MSDFSRHESDTGRNKHMSSRVRHRSHSCFLVCRTQSDIEVQRVKIDETPLHKTRIINPLIAY